MKILITGKNGYLAKELQKQLSTVHSVTGISRAEFDLTDAIKTHNWFQDKHFDVVIHTAIAGGSRLREDTATVLDNNLKMYYNLLDHRDHFTRFISIGSGAELYLTDTPYGLSKHVIRQSILNQPQFYNIRVFATFDENELDTRFIKANLKRYINKENIIIHQNRYMDFFYLQDFIRVVQYYIDSDAPPKEFNCSYEEASSLLSIATFINTLSDYTVSLITEDATMAPNYNGEHTPSPLVYTGLERGIQNVYEKLLCNP